MTAYSVAEAKNKLSQLIKRAVEGEDVIITSHGQPIVELKPVKRQPKQLTEADWEWLETHRLPRLDPNKDAVELVREFRDEAEP
jgi:prevent-host-death family protein